MREKFRLAMTKFDVRRRCAELVPARDRDGQTDASSGFGRRAFPEYGQEEIPPRFSWTISLEEIRIARKLSARPECGELLASGHETILECDDFNGTKARNLSGWGVWYAMSPVEIGGVMAVSTENIDKLKKELERQEEIEITVVGRKSGRAITTPVWFVLEGNTVYLLPVKGSDTQWFKNLVERPSLTLHAAGVRSQLNVQGVSDPTQV